MQKSKRIKLTVGRIGEITPPETGQAFVWDTDVPGLAIRVTPKSRSFVFERRFNGKTIRITIGSTTAWSIPNAREKGREYQRLIDQGIDPRVQKAEQKAAEERKTLLVSDVWAAYLRYHKPKWSDRHYKDNEWLARAPKEDKNGDMDDGGVLHPLLSKKLSDIDAQHLIQWGKHITAQHEARVKKAENQRKAKKQRSNIRGRNTALRQGYVRLRALWNWAFEREEYAGAMADPKIFAHADLKNLLPKVQPKRDALQKGQLKDWFAAMGKISNPVISSYLKILLLTGARRNELSMLKWEDIDFRYKSMTLHDKIEEAGRIIPLSPYVEYLINALPRRNEWVFSSPKSKTDGRLKEPRIAHDRALLNAAMPSLSLHGLRRSFASLCEWCEMPAGVAAQIMGHKPSATAEKHYIQRPVDLLAIWLGKYETWVLEQAEIPFNPQKVKKGFQVVS